jgi:hypothetical protein
VIVASNSAMTLAALIVAVHVPDLGCLGISAAERDHSGSFWAVSRSKCNASADDECN